MVASGESEDVDHQRSPDLYAVLAHLQPDTIEGVVHAIADAKISLSKLKLLHILARPHERPPRISRVGALLGLQGPQATRLVSELDEARLVDRIDDEDDARVKRVLITPKGRALLEQLAELSRARIRELDQFLGSLTDEERKLLYRTLDALLKRPSIAARRPAD